MSTSPAERGASPALVLEMADAAIPSLREGEGAALEQVNWRVHAGDFWAIAGLARTGKTNLMLVAAGVLRPMSGRYRLFDRDFTAGFESQHLAFRLRVGMVFDGGQLLQHLTLAENVALPMDYHDSDEPTSTPEAIARRLEELIEFTGLRKWATARPATVNRNWQQRFGLARALALKPEILLLDSPLSGLDPRDASWWLETLDALGTGHPIVGQRPMTLVVTGDDMRPWRSRARRFAVVSDRRFIDVGERANLDQHPEPILRELLPSGWGPS